MGAFGCLKRSAGVLLVAAFVAVMPLTIWFATFNMVVLDRNTYLNALSGEGVYTVLIPHLLPDLVKESGHEPAGDADVTVADLFGNLTAEDWEAITQLLIPPDWLRGQFEGNINALFDWLEGDQPLPDLTIDTASLRERLTGPEGREAANRLITSWEPCTPEQVTALERFLDGQGAFVVCEPPGRMLAPVSAAAAEPALETVASALPESFTLRQYVAGQPDAGKFLHEMNQFKYGMNVFRRLAPLWYLIPAAILSLVVIVVVRNAQSCLTWMGAALIAGGLATLAWPVFLLLSGLRVDPLRDPANAALSQAGPMVVGAVQGLVNSLIGSYTLPMLAQAALAALLGLAGLAAALALRPRYALPPAAATANATAARAGPAARPPEPPKSEAPVE